MTIFLIVCEIEYAINHHDGQFYHVTDLDYGTEEFQHKIPNLSEIMSSVFSNKISGHFGPHVPSSNRKNNLEISRYQIFIVWILGSFQASKNLVHLTHILSA